MASFVGRLVQDGASNHFGHTTFVSLAKYNIPNPLSDPWDSLTARGTPRHRGLGIPPFSLPFRGHDSDWDTNDS